MKRFFIFAAMLLAMTSNAVNLSDNPPIVHPKVDHIILTPRDMMDKDRSMAICEYWYDSSANCFELLCYDTGHNTELYLLDQDGQLVDYYTLDSDIASNAILEVPSDDNTYKIILISEKYYGEASIDVR